MRLQYQGRELQWKELTLERPARRRGGTAHEGGDATSREEAICRSPLAKVSVRSGAGPRSGPLRPASAPPLSTPPQEKGTFPIHGTMGTFLSVDDKVLRFRLPCPPLACCPTLAYGRFLEPRVWIHIAPERPSPPG